MKIKLYLVSISILFALLACNSNESEEINDTQIDDTTKAKYLEEGQKISDIYFNTFRTHLTSHIESDGIPGALEFCSENAYNLTDSLNSEFQIYVKRASLKLRNPDNAPNDREKEMLDLYNELLSKGEKLKDSIIKLTNTRYWYVKPILTLGLCENCHGSLGTSLKEDNYALIKKLYPKDDAINHTQGDLRGIWSIEMEEKD